MPKKAGLPDRDSAADLLRIIAVLFVIGIHFSIYTDFYKAPIDCPRMTVMLFIRSACAACVPLFLTLSGYLMTNKRLSRSYYRGVGKTYFTYVVAGLCCMLLYPALYGWLRPVLGLKEQTFSEVRFSDVVWKTLSFKSAPYAWYVEMYLGLFLLMPFLNVLYHGLDSRRRKRLLLATLFVIACLPSLLNVYDFTDPGWWSSPSSSESWQKLIPSFWYLCYPLFYYFLGSYIREYGIRMKPWQAALGFVGSCLTAGFYNLWRSAGVPFQSGEWTDWQSALLVPMAWFLFAFFTNLRTEKMPGALRWCAARLSGLCLGIYLTSWIFENLFYKVVKGMVPEIRDRLEVFFWMVPLVFVCSAVLSYAIQKLYALWSFLRRAAVRRLRRAKPETT